MLHSSGYRRDGSAGIDQESDFMPIDFTIEYIVTMAVAQQHDFLELARCQGGKGLVGIVLLIEYFRKQQCQKEKTE